MGDSPVKIGLDLDPTQSSWAEQREIVTLADELGFDSLWTWDHLYGVDDPSRSIYEGWTTIAAWGAITSRATVGLLVTANTFRNPGLLAKMAVTVDHITGGRCVLGLGAGWRPREHADHGIPFGSGFGERLAWLDESLGIVRGLLADETVSSPLAGRYDLAGAAHLPLPVRGAGRVPILVGGGGERKTLRIVAKYADMWHHRGPPEYLVRKLEVLRGHCDAVGRDPAKIELVFDQGIVIRDDASDARAVFDERRRRHGEPAGGEMSHLWVGPPAAIAERWRSYLELGFRHLIVDLPTPYDRKTVEGMVEVRELVSSAH